MSKILLVGINSQYVHTNLAIRYIKNYVENYSSMKLEIYESSINNQLSAILTDIFEKSPEKIIFSTYIWNKEYVFKLVKEIKKIMPNTSVILGGPEVSYLTDKIMHENPEIDFIITGEGEKSTLDLLSESIEDVKGVYYRKEGQIKFNGYKPPISNLDEIPFPYSEEELKNSKNKILYYESSRGCPFECSYCMSSLDKSVRYFSLERVKEDLKKFLQEGITLIKFVDRTFNIDKRRYMDLWKFLLENYREEVTFHFEISGDLFDEETIAFLEKIPQGFFQFEIGVQTINEKTMKAIKRENDLERLKNNVLRIKENIHLHLDLIAGLPYEDYDTFKNSFDYVYSLKPEMIQLGFLKVLKGTLIFGQVEKYNYKFLNFPTYEVLSNEFISYKELTDLKKIETVLDYYYNSENYPKTIEYILKHHYKRPFDFYEDIARYYDSRGYFKVSHKQVSIFNHLYEFYLYKGFSDIEIFKEYLKYDYLTLKKPGSYPYWIKSIKDKEKYNEILKSMNFKSIREGHNKTEFEKFEYNVVSDKSGEVEILFIYNRKETKIQEY
ncbi:B12-binding domain-containing radical SAM protein [Ilyobacter polytropus]|uniref:Radical SAM domain protein n=1 Tax=Ilyobacter polytropus (strain ATCC 51220 / DSM 2926 / LMG 16218 / CuHBu1) TaxID=572544 RepID=E3H9Y8_ILYPC|nr:B12-binding domain-containing radical SAM protein [Ilyobacter polytropus]ADO83116.1 Radical SAM domain protein [Ilyobacter polytropus DSM 2926]